MGAWTRSVEPLASTLSVGDFEAGRAFVVWRDQGDVEFEAGRFSGHVCSHPRKDLVREVGREIGALL